MGILSFRGRDAMGFLHSQLTADVQALLPGEALPAAWCSAQGRVLAVLWLLAVTDGVMAVLPRPLAPPVADGLRRFVLRSRVTIVDESGPLAVAGLVGDPQDLSATTGAGIVVGRLRAGRALLVGTPAALEAACRGLPAGTEAAWTTLALRQGEPVVTPETSGAWIPQMLNLDLLGAVSFSKGCYPGQEIVARAHHLGRVKRRMARYEARTGSPLPEAGQALFAQGEKVAEVVSAAPGAPGQVLAVVNLEALGRPLAPAGGAPSLDPAPLPYALPEAPPRT